ncbi:MAG: RdgB/HAM1 family non-canonical purine NTP pyrophosphatase [Crocinitomicaceae bacterium]|nr:RdgB/HAM1 family non-canonical purine NTP pyrophosphatase [Crocinitomicaceae bacterium]
MKLVFATSNKNKAAEIAKLLPTKYEVLSLNDIGHSEEIPETSATIEGNAQQKSNYIVNQYSMNCFADDTGLEVPSLNNEPGVRSARYAGSDRCDDKNLKLLLDKLSTKKDRSARFRTVISLELNGANYQFEGIVIGKILIEKKGAHGFGYDPIFEPENCGRSFAEMTMDEKNEYSHRARAFKKMIDFLEDTP